ncbi:MAG TPA: glycosyltransferase [Aggregatilineales bacterium]|nr:glycosyltransferase [Anaerolineales bacterium]HRE46499.1 glycosyltransferase [Aggregatilineales bacterium]
MTTQGGQERSPLRMALFADVGHVNIQRWAEGLIGAGAEVHLISFRRGQVAGATLHILQKKLPGKGMYLSALPAARRLLREIQPEVVAAYYVTGYGLLAALTGVHPLVQVTSGSDVLIAPHNPLMRAVVRFTLSRADLITAWADHMAAAALKVFPQQKRSSVANRLMVLPRGIPAETFAAVHSPPPAADQALRIISTRSLRPAYKIDTIIRAVGLLRREGVDVYLTIAGEGALRGELEGLAAELKVTDRVRFAGFVPNDQLPGLLAQHTTYLAVIDTDGVSASLLEGMAVGLLPVVADHLANRMWLKAGENGVLLDDLSPGGVAAALRRAHGDLGLRTRAWSANAQIVRERADLSLNSARYVGAFRALAAKGRS